MQKDWVQPREEDLTSTVRVSFVIDRSLYEKMISLIPWGVRWQFFTKILEISLSQIKEGRYEIVAAILAGDYDPLKGGTDDV